MKTILFLTSILLLTLNTLAQQTGDTIVVKAFKYGSNSRDTLIQFPNTNQTYEKIILKYNMRCKNGLVSTQSQRNLGCGEWDYSCNTYIADSSRIDEELNTHPNYIITNFSGNTFNYTTTQPYDYYNYTQTQVNYSVVSESSYTAGIGASLDNNLMNTTQQSGRAQLLYTAAELIAAGFSAGAIDGILVNVSNTGGTANFFRMGLKQTTLTAVNTTSVNTSGFTNVYLRNTTFNTGLNRIQFHTPFNWNGTSNLLIDYSFTNSSPSNAITLVGATTPTVMAAYANTNAALDLSNNGRAIINAALMSNISSEVTISFWAYGYSNQLPTNTSILYATPTNTAQRSLNIHLPWSDNTIYFDCGVNTNTSNFDRLSKAAVAANIGGQWNHWAFIKNLSTGDMRIFLNGNPWAFTSNKYWAISFVNLILGSDYNGNNNYKGKVNELAIWNREFSSQEIKDYFLKSINNTHPFYSNLIAYYKLNEGNGLVINDTKGNLTSNCTNTSWTYDRGHTLTRMFNDNTVRPTLVFLRGSYNLTTTTLTVKDSLPRVPFSVRQFSIISNAGATTFTNDVVIQTASFQSHQALSNTYNGDTGALTATLALPADGTYNITNLPYYNRYPFYNELLSFVTPYGIGLDMGMNGKTWYFDVSDLAPLLKGPKRFLMSQGGEYQEQMDIDFWFIVGTPPRTVVEYKQLWSASHRGQTSIGSILNNTRFAPLNVALKPNAQFFKLRSSITGHGSEGEFGQNGGTIQHYLNINGGANEFAWPITERCAFNPVYPQGGTWVYDRQGWCPGQASLLKENNLTPFVTPGSTVSIDYNCINPPVANGDYRYHVSHQLISYGGANHTLDANLVEVSMPSNKVLYSRTNPMCAYPVIKVQNTGSSPLTSLQIEYWLNSATAKQSYTWTGNLSFMDTTSITLPIGTLWQSGIQSSGNVFNAELKKANSNTDQYSYNNTYRSPFSIADILTNTIVVEFKTNNYPSENTYKLIDENGNTLPGVSTITLANTTYTDTYQLTGGCYRLVVTDSGEDGVQWWASTSQGSGFIRFKNESGTIIKTFQPDFGGGFEYSFSAASLQNISENELTANVRIYPNPAHHFFYVSGTALENANLRLTDLLGKEMGTNITKENGQYLVNTKALSPGVYILEISKDGQTGTKKIVVY